MRDLLRMVDGLLRGSFTQKESLAEGKIGVATGKLVSASALLGCVYGVFMGLYGVLRPENESFAQLVATTFKVPLLFLLTLVVAYPSLYVFSALARSSLRFAETLRLLLVAITVDLAVLASLGPVTAFFTLSTDSYHFMILMNVAFFGMAGFVGLRFLLGAMGGLYGRPGAPSRARAANADHPAVEPHGGGEVESDPGADPPGSADFGADFVFRIWVVIFGVVGAQMGWILRPFIGSPEMPFALFRERESNFFGAVARSLRGLFS